MHKTPETLGTVIKAARQRSEITMESLAEKVGINHLILNAVKVVYPAL